MYKSLKQSLVTDIEQPPRMRKPFPQGHLSYPGDVGLITYGLVSDIFSFPEQPVSCSRHDLSTRTIWTPFPHAKAPSGQKDWWLWVQ